MSFKPERSSAITLLLSIITGNATLVYSAIDYNYYKATWLVYNMITSFSRYP